jgi:hypothetical protein
MCIWVWPSYRRTTGKADCSPASGVSRWPPPYGMREWRGLSERADRSTMTCCRRVCLAHEKAPPVRARRESNRELPSTQLCGDGSMRKPRAERGKVPANGEFLAARGARFWNAFGLSPRRGAARPGCRIARLQKCVCAASFCCLASACRGDARRLSFISYCIMLMPRGLGNPSRCIIGAGPWGTYQRGSQFVP